MSGRASAAKLLLGGAALGAAVALALTPPRVAASTPPQGDATRIAREIEREHDHVTAVELGEWIRDRRPGLRVIDVRAESAYAAYHVPTAERAELAEVAGRRPVPGETLVLYSEGGAHAAQAWVLLRQAGHDRVYFLRGGILDWLDEVMAPPAVDTAALSPEARMQWRRAAAVRRYFGGLPSVDARRDPTRPPTVQRARRRGC